MKWMMVGLYGLIFFSLNSHGDCSRPDPPDIPDPATAVTAQMVKSQNDVKAYLANAEKYLKCVRSDRDHDGMVDEMKKIGDEFNQVIRTFKARMK